MPNRADVNWKLLADHVEIASGARQLSYSNVAKQIGIPRSGLSKLMRGGHLSADAVARVLYWLNPDDVPGWIRRPT